MHSSIDDPSEKGDSAAWDLLKNQCGFFPDINISNDINSFFTLACTTNKLDVAKLLHESKFKINIYTYYLVFIHACENDHLEMAKWLFGQIDMDTNEKFFIYACKKCFIKMINFLHNNILDINIKTYIFAFYYACENDNLELAKWLFGQPKIFNTKNNVFIYICANGLIKPAQILYNIMPDISIDVYNKAFKLTCENGHLVTAQWLYEIRPDINIGVNGHLNVAEWLFEIKWNLWKNRCGISTDINISKNIDSLFMIACRENDLEIAKWLHNNESKIKITTYIVVLSHACENNHLKMTLWLSDQFDVEIKTKFFKYACKTGHTKMANFLYNIIPNIDFKTYFFAFCDTCLNDHLELANLLFKKPKFNKNNVFIFVCGFGYTKPAKFLHDNMPDINISVFNKAFKLTCKNGHLVTAQWLYKIKPDIDISVDDHNHPNVVEWLLEIKWNLWKSQCGIHFDTNINDIIDRVFIVACIQNDLEMAKWLFNKQPNINISNGIFISACENGDTDTANLIYQINPAINVSVLNEAFRLTCRNGRLFTAQWLLSICPEIVIGENYEHALNEAFYNAQIEVADWLLEIKNQII
jgi:translation initiation factor IF-1/aromatic ring-cleaving dioxygenase